MYDPLGILTDTKPKGQQQVDPLGILPVKKKDVGVPSTLDLWNTGLPKSGEATSQLENIKNSDDPVKTLLEPVRNNYKDAETKYNLINQNEKYHSEQVKPLADQFGRIIPQSNELVQATQEHNKAVNDLAVTHEIVKNSLFKNGKQAKQYKEKIDEAGKTDPNNETQQLAKEKSDEYDKIKNDVYGEDGTGSIAAAALREKLDSDPNFHQKFINMYKEGIGLSQEEEARLIADYTVRHKNDLEELSKENPDIKTDYEDVTKNLINRFPDYGKIAIAQKITDEREKRGLNSWIGNFNTSTASKHNTEVSTDILSPEEQKFYKENKSEIDSKIVKGGFLNNLANIKNLPETTKETIEDIAGLDKSKGEAAYNELMPNVYDPSKGWKQVAGTLGDLTGKMVYMALISKGLGGAGIAPEVASKAAVPLTFGKQILDESRSEFPDDDVKAKVSALAKMGLMTFLNPLHADKATEAVNSILSKATDGEAVSTLRGKLIKGIMATGKEVATSSSQMIAYSGAAKIVDKALGLDEQTFRQFHPENEMEESAKQGAIMGVIPGVLKGISEVAKKSSVEPEKLFNEKLSFDQKYKKVPVEDMFIGETKEQSVKSIVRTSEKQHNILDNLIKCLTA